MTNIVVSYHAAGMDALIRRMAKLSASSPGKAADNIDKVIHKIITKLRQGESAKLPGLGSFTPGPSPQFHPEPSDAERSERTRRVRR